MSGIKTIINRSNVMISVILRGRVGAEPSAGSLPPVTASIPPGGSTSLAYGNDANPYLNSLDVEEISGGSDIRQSYVVTSRGGDGTLDFVFNTNSVLEVTYSRLSYSFSLIGHN